MHLFVSQQREAVAATRSALLPCEQWTQWVLHYVEVCIHTLLPIQRSFKLFSARSFVASFKGTSRKFRVLQDFQPTLLRLDFLQKLENSAVSI